MGRLIDFTGQHFGRLTAIRRIGNDKDNRAVWLCKCDCGKEIALNSRILIKGKIEDCGCTEDLTGQKFEKLTVVQRDISIKNRRSMWLCQCDCGNQKVVRSRDLKGGHIKSCGCLKTKYCITNKRIFNIWCHMTARCKNKNRRDSKYYIEKGITVCEEWKKYENFEKWALDNGYDDNLTLDRVDNNGNYCPENCQWITIAEQQRKKDGNIWIEYNGERKILADWAREYGVNRQTLWSRITTLGYTFDEAINKKDGIAKNSVIIPHNGKDMSLSQYARLVGVSVSLVSKDLKRGLTVEEMKEHTQRIGEMNRNKNKRKGV